MKSVLTVVLFMLIGLHSLLAQIDSFSVNEYTFRYSAPNGWPLVSKDNGICEYEETNLKFEWPSKYKDCFGSMMMSISEVTQAEKKKRDEPKSEEDNPRLEGESSFEMEYSGFNTFCGYYDQRLFADTFSYVNNKGTLVLKKKPSSSKKLVPVHQYARWIYYNINDSIEMVIYFQGVVRHWDETDIDWEMNQFAKFFFKSNKETLDSMIHHTGPWRNETATLPMDSLSVLKTFLKYPVMPEWTYDTTRTGNEIKTTFLRVKSKDQEICNHAEITMSYRTTTLDNTKPKAEDFRNVSLLDLFIATQVPEKEKPKPLSDSARKAMEDSSFKAAEQHFYFTQASNHSLDDRCATSDEFTESLNVFVYTKTDERIKITVTMTMVATDPIDQRDYYHAYFRFIYFFATGNDFETIYVLNKQ